MGARLELGGCLKAEGSGHEWEERLFWELGEGFVC